MNYNELNTKFAIPGQLEFVKGKGNFPFAVITNRHAKAEVSLYGAQVLSFIPEGQKDVLWLSPKSVFGSGKPIRGGIPVCFPWFGPHATDSQKPMHGFARLLTWHVLETFALRGGNTRLVLGLTNNAETTALWPFAFSAKIIIEVGEKLDVALCYTNTGGETFTVSDALHSYFSISNIANIGISGLKGCYYYAGFTKEANNRQIEDTLKIVKEENRRYINHAEDCVISDPAWDRKIRVAKKGSKVTVVWNPYAETARTMADISETGYPYFICVEAVNALTDLIKVKPGESHCVSTVLSLV
jgi:glucose-6-phosphate 1-epimerase